MSPNGGGRFLRESTCWDLLRSRTVGRVCWLGSTGPVVMPVDYRLEGAHVLVGVSPTAGFDAERYDGRRITLQVDNFEDAASERWSVIMQGICYDAPADTPHDFPAYGHWPLLLQVEPERAAGILGL